MKIDNYLTRWQEFHDWSAANRPEILASVESLGKELRNSIAQYREASNPDDRQEQLDAIKQHYDRVVQWHMKEILSKISGE